MFFSLDYNAHLQHVMQVAIKDQYEGTKSTPVHVYKMQYYVYLLLLLFIDQLAAEVQCLQYTVVMFIE